MNIKKTFSLVKFNFNFIKVKYFSESIQKYSEKEALELVESGVFEVLKGAAKCKLDKLSRAATFKDLGFDSLDQVELVVALEEKFEVDISDDDSLKINTVLDAIQIFNKAFMEKHSSSSELISSINEGKKL